MKEDDEKIIAKAAKMYVRQTQLGWLKLAILFPLVLGYLGYQHWFSEPVKTHEVAYIEVGSTYDRAAIRQIVQNELSKDSVRAVIVEMVPDSPAPSKAISYENKEVFLVVSADEY